MLTTTGAIFFFFVVPVIVGLVLWELLKSRRHAPPPDINLDSVELQRVRAAVTKMRGQEAPAEAASAPRAPLPRKERRSAVLIDRDLAEQRGLHERLMGRVRMMAQANDTSVPTGARAMMPATLISDMRTELESQITTLTALTCELEERVVSESENAPKRSFMKRLEHAQQMETASIAALHDTVMSQPIIDDTPDDLKRIRGIGPVIEQTLNELGIQSFTHLANLDIDGLEQLSDRLGSLRSRMQKDRWIEQARELTGA